MEKRTDSKLRKEYIKAVYCHPAYFSFMQSTSCEMLTEWSSSFNQVCWKWYQYPHICRWHHTYGRKWKELQCFLMTLKEEHEKAGLKLSIQKTKIMASGPISSWLIDGETMGTVRDFILSDSKITADIDCSHEIKRCLLIGRKAMTNLDSILKSRDITSLTKVH